VWDSLKSLSAISNLPRIVVGDFNEALWQQEHLSCTPRPERQMAAFRVTLALCNLVDLGFKGLPYTYDNKRRGRANVRVRLDRAVATSEWRDLFSAARVEHLVSPVSDHCPILVCLM
jgi:endonuclease/exonuclease/phosphatase family metal-dependent hydrolase